MTVDEGPRPGVANVLVLATMGAGKSTLLNALIGKDLLPSGNLTSTARVFRIEHDKTSDFQVRFSNDPQLQSWVPATRELLLSANHHNQPGVVDVRGNIGSIKTGSTGLTLHDTPGANNSSNKNQESLSLGAGPENNPGLLLYVLDATQLGTVDDTLLLKQVHAAYRPTESSGNQVVFIVNKADHLDEERNESLNKHIAATRSYLENNRFSNPLVITVSALAALLARKTMHGERLTSSENRAYHRYINTLLEQPDQFWDASLLRDDKKKKALERFQAGTATITPGPDSPHKAATPRLHKLLYASGIPMLEFILESFLSEKNESLPIT